MTLILKKPIITSGGLSLVLNHTSVETCNWHSSNQKVYSKNLILSFTLLRNGLTWPLQLIPMSLKVYSSKITQNPWFEWETESMISSRGFSTFYNYY